MTNRISVIFVEYDTELLRPIKQCAVYDEDEIGQQYEQSYNFFVHRIRNWIVMSDSTGYGLWWKTNKDNDMIDHTCVIYIEIGSEL